MISSVKPTSVLAGWSQRRVSQAWGDVQMLLEPAARDGWTSDGLAAAAIAFDRLREQSENLQTWVRWSCIVYFGWTVVHSLVSSAFSRLRFAATSD